jgi:hypothetical protein
MKKAKWKCVDTSSVILALLSFFWAAFLSFKDRFSFVVHEGMIHMGDVKVCMSERTREKIEGERKMKKQNGSVLVTSSVILALRSFFRAASLSFNDRCSFVVHECFYTWVT